MAEPRYQAFLSHNSADKPTVEEMARRLEREGIACWFDRWNLIPGEAWRPALERGIRQSETCLIFVGPSGFSQWHTEEMDLAIREGVERKPRALRVLPVLLPGGREVAAAELPGFLKGKTWVQFSRSVDDPEAFRRLVCGIRGVEPGPAAEQAPFVDRCPYVGLRPFRAEESPFFFGREGTVRQLLARLGNWFGTRDERRLLAVLGPSGSGKSSVIAARLLPVLQHGGLPGSERWLYVSCKPGPDPWESLQVALGSHPEVRPHLPAIALQVAGSGDESATLHLAGRYALNQPDDPRRLALFVDQFEEVFTYARRDRGESLREAADVDGLGPGRRLFIENLLHAVREEQGRVIVILALRADFYGHCAVLPALRTAVSENQVLLGPMSRDELRDAIECPAQRCGLEVEPALVERLLDDMERQPGALPFLQHTLEQLWKAREGRRLTATAFDQMGSLEGAVDRYAEDYFLSLKSDQQRLLRRILLDLVQLGEGAADTKRRRALHDLPGGKTEDLHLFIKDLADRNLVTTSQPLGEAIAGKAAGEVQVELSHEALLRGWKSFQRWIDASRDQLRLRDRIEEAARQWEQHSKDESYLWRGGQLAGAQVELSRSELELSDESHAFLAACDAEWQRELRRKERGRRITVGFAALAGVAAIAATIGAIAALEQKRAANEQLAEVSWLVAQQAGGIAFEANEVSPIKAAHYLLRAASATYLAHDNIGTRDAMLAARAQAANIVSTLLHDGPVLGATTSPDKRLILTWSVDGTARLWDARDGAPAGPPMKHDGAVNSPQFIRGGQMILTWSNDGTEQLWHAKDGAPAGPPITHGAGVTGARFSADGQWILTWSADGTARLWDAMDGAPPGPLMTLDGPVSGAQFSADGRRVLTWGTDGTAWLWNATDGKVVYELIGHHRAINGAQFIADGPWILTWSKDGTTRLWNAEDGSPVGDAMSHDPDKEVWGVQFVSDGKRILTWGEDGTARLWNAADRSLVGRPMEHGKPVNGAQFNADGQRIVTWSADRTARLWNAKDASPLGGPMRHKGVVWGAQFSADGQRVLTWSDDGMARLWNVTDGNAVGLPMKHEAAIDGAQFIADGQRILTRSADGTARLWNTTDGLAVGQPMKHQSAVSDARFVSDGQRILTWSDDGTAQLWDVTDGKAIGQPIHIEKAGVRDAEFNATGTQILTWSDDGTARLWNVADGNAVDELIHPGKVDVKGARFSVDGQRIVAWSDDGTARLWNVTDGKAIDQPIQIEGADIRGAQFSDNGQRILTWGFDKDHAVRQWRTTDGSAVGWPIKHDEEVRGARFNGMGTQILTWSDDRTARLWNAEDGSPVKGGPMKHDKVVRDAWFNAAGTQILTRSDDRTARLWNAEDGSPVKGGPMKHDKAVRGAQFSADGRRVLTWSDDDTARLWSAGNSHCILVLRHNSPVTSASFNQDETLVLTVSEDGAARLWDLSLDDWVPPEERILEFEVRSATTIGADGQVRVLSTREWNDRREKLLRMEIRSGLTLTPSGTIRTLTSDDVAARKRQLDEIRRNRRDKQ